MNNNYPHPAAAEIKTALEAMGLSVAETLLCNDIAHAINSVLISQLSAVCLRDHEKYHRLMRGTGFIVLKVIQAATDETEKMLGRNK